MAETIVAYIHFVIGGEKHPTFKSQYYLRAENKRNYESKRKANEVRLEKQEFVCDFLGDKEINGYGNPSAFLEFVSEEFGGKIYYSEAKLKEGEKKKILRLGYFDVEKYLDGEISGGESKKIIAADREDVGRLEKIFFALKFEYPEIKKE